MQSKPEKGAKPEKPETYDVYPLSQLIRNMAKLQEILKDEERKEEAKEAKTSDQKSDLGPIVACRQTLAFLEELSTELGDVSERLQVGFIKETKDYGNTSVTFGAAIQIALTNPKLLLFNVGNFGSGGGRGYQFKVIRSEKGELLRIEVVKEITPPDKRTPSPNAIEIVQSAKCIYKPEKNTGAFADHRAYALDMFHMASEAPWFALITGPIRIQYQKAEAEQKTLMDGVIQLLFSDLNYNAQALPVPLPGGQTTNSFFLSQDMEATFELMATQGMYQFLAAAHLIPPTHQVVASLGIGGSSVQMAFGDAFGSNMSLLLQVGMARPEALRAMTEDLMCQLHKSRKMFLQAFEGVPEPVLALKSGCLIYWQRNAALAAVLAAKAG
jgi:hypothetical protein